MAEPTDAAHIPVTSTFVRGRNALVTKAKFSELYTDYYLHLMQHGLKYEGAIDSMLKDALAAMTLHLMSRPPAEVVAWTIHFEDPKLNLFVTGSTQMGNVTGRGFTEDVRDGEENVFIAQVVTPGKPVYQSVVPFDGNDVIVAAEMFYRQSQQLPVRFFRMEDAEEFALVAPMPDADFDWIEALSASDVAALDEAETTRLLQTRHYYFGCECTLEKIFAAVAALGKSRVEDLFAGDDVLSISCPRCGAKYAADRAAVAGVLDSLR